MKTFYIISAIIFLQIISFAQRDVISSKDSISREGYEEEVPAKIGIAVRSYSDSVIVRWAVSKLSHWERSKVNGFILKRAIIQRDGSYSEFVPVKEGAFKPWTEEKWLEYFKSRKQVDESKVDYETFAYNFGIAKNEPPKRGSSSENELQDLKDSKSRSDWQILFTVLSANSSVAAAEGLGLRYVDKTVKRGEKYAYKISLAETTSQFKIEPGIAEVTIQAYDPDFAKQEIYSTEYDGSIGLNWKVNDNITFYNINRSEDNGATFKRLTKLPLLTFQTTADSNRSEGYQDTVVVNYKPLIYRVYGTTSFADEVLIGEVKAMGRDRTPPEQPFVPQPEHISDNKIKIKWQMSDTPANDLKGFYIGRDSSSHGEFKYITELLPPSTREFIDENFLRDGDNYYLVEAVDTAGNISQSHPVYTALNDTTPPSAPRWEKGSMDARGVVTLRLKPNGEKDLMGYRILISNSPEHEFSSIIESFGEDSINFSRIIEFQDTVTLETTTRFVYYRATALDNRFNESELSEIIAVPRIDVVAPVSPVIHNVEVTDKSVSLALASSSSDDVKHQIAYRRIMGEDKWDSLAVLNSSDSVFTDLNVKPNIMYEYSLMAVDSAGLRSELSSPISARAYYTGVLSPIKNLKIEYDEKRNGAMLRWDYENPDGVYFVIYRTFEDTKPKRYATVKEPGTKSFTDVNLKSGKGNYTYAVKVFDDLGGESKMSEPVNINVK